MRTDGRGRKLVCAAVLGALFGYACGDRNEAETANATNEATSSGGSASGSSGTNSTGGATDGGTGGSLGTGGSSGSAGAAGEGGDAHGGSAAAAGSGGGGEPWCVSDTQVPRDDCEFPESLGGGDAPESCGVTPGAWYPLGDSEPLVWPGRAIWDSASGEGVSESLGTASESRVAFDAEGRVIVSWVEAAGVRVRRWEGEYWSNFDPVPGGADSYPRPTHDLAVDSAGNVIVAQRVEAAVSVHRSEQGGWQSLGEFPPLWADPNSGSVLLAVDDSDAITLAWHEGEEWSEKEQVRVLRHAGGDWVELGNPFEAYSVLSLALMPDGSPVLSWEAWGTSAIMLQYFDGEAWIGLGESLGEAGISAQGSGSGPTDIAVTADGAVVVSWRNHYRVWDGDEWAALQDFANTPQGSVLATNAAGALYAMAHDVGGVSRWVNGAWEPLPEQPEFALGPVSLAVSSDQDLAASVIAPNGEAMLELYRDGVWQALGERTAEATGVINGEAPQLLLKDDGTGYLISASCEVAHWDGVAWQPVVWPDLSLSPFDCVGALDQVGGLALAYLVRSWVVEEDGDFQNSLFVTRQVGGDWEEFGVVDESGALEAGDYTPEHYKVVFDASNSPIVAYATSTDDEVHVVRWEGEAWMRLAGSDDGDLNSGYNHVIGTRLTLSSDDRPVVAVLTNSSLGGYVAVLEWSGEAWNELEPDALPVSDSYDTTWRTLDLALNASDMPVLAWRAGDEFEMYVWSGTTWEHLPATENLLARLPERIRWDVRIDEGEVRLSRFQDCRWTGVSASDRGGGVSNSASPSFAPSLALGPEGVCVAWNEWVEAGWRVFLRCHD